MTLNEFIAAKPKELRLGQWFVNCYWRGSDPMSRRLYQQHGDQARRSIEYIMEQWQWDSLPDIDK